MHARPPSLRRVDFQMVRRSDFYGGRSETPSCAAALLESEGQDNLDGVYEISGGTTTSAFLQLKASNINQKTGNMTTIYAKNMMKEWRL